MKIILQKSSPLKREAHNFCFQKTFLKTTEACFRIYFFKWKPSFQKRPGHCRLLFSKKAKTETRNIGSAEQPIHLYSSLSLVRRTLPLDPPSRDAFFSDPATLSRLLSAAEATPSSEIIESPDLHSSRARHTTHVCQQPWRDLCLRLRRWSSAARPQFREELHWKGWFRKRLFCEAKFTWVQALYIGGFEESIYGGDRGLVWRGSSRTVHICWNCKSGTVKLYSSDTEVFAISHVSDSYLSLRLCIYDVIDYF